MSISIFMCIFQIPGGPTAAHPQTTKRTAWSPTNSCLCLSLLLLRVCDPLCENPAKILFFCDFLASTKKHNFSYGEEQSVKILPLYL